jgi:hypothetical protein
MGKQLVNFITCLSPIQHGFAPGFVNYKKACTRLAAACDKVYQLLAHGRWFSPGTPASSHRSQDICPLISQIVLKNFIKISLIVKECPEEILIKLAIDLS